MGDLLDQVEGELCIDRNRVYSTGLSWGGLMTTVLGCRLSDRIAAAAPVAGIAVLDPCDRTRPVPAVIFHGTDDEFLAYDGGVGAGAEDLPLPDDPGETAAGRRGRPRSIDVLPGAEASAAAWAEGNGCPDAEPADGAGGRRPSTASTTAVRSSSTGWSGAATPGRAARSTPPSATSSAPSTSVDLGQRDHVGLLPGPPAVTIRSAVTLLRSAPPASPMRKGRPCCCAPLRSVSRAHRLAGVRSAPRHGEPVVVPPATPWGGAHAEVLVVAGAQPRQARRDRRRSSACIVTARARLRHHQARVRHRPGQLPQQERPGLQGQRRLPGPVRRPGDAHRRHDGRGPHGRPSCSPRRAIAQFDELHDTLTESGQHPRRRHAR